MDAKSSYVAALSSSSTFVSHPCSSSSNNRINSPVEPHKLPLRRPKPSIIPLKTSSSWKKKNEIISTNTTCTNVLRIMNSLCLPIPPDMYTSLIKECTFEKDSPGALELLNHMRRRRRNVKPTLPFVNRLLLMLVSCGEHDEARQLFDEMTVRDFNTWAIMIVGYIDIADYEESITLFVEMMYKNSHMLLKFPAWIIVWVIKACVCTMDVELGKQVHGLLFKSGGIRDISLTVSLINFYGKFRCLEDADFVFSQLKCHNNVVWTAKIVNNFREGHFHQVLDDFKEMARERIKKNSDTVNIVLKACVEVDDNGNCGQQVHADIIKIGLESDEHVQCGLVDMYGKCGLLRDAEMVFELIVDKEYIANWKAMLMGYICNGFYVEAFKFLYQMKASGIQIQESLINEVRIACGSGTGSDTLPNRIEKTVDMIS